MNRTLAPVSLLNWMLVLGIPFVLALTRAVGFPSTRVLDAWMAGHGLEPDGHGRALIRTYLSRSRWIRTVGFLLGWVGAVVYSAGFRTGDDTPLVFWVMGGAFVASVLVAELCRPQPDGEVTSTSPRDRYTYVPAFTRADQLVLMGLFLVPLQIGVARDLDLSVVLLAAIGAAVVLALSLLTQEWILRRPQRAATVELLRVDDAMRSHNATGTAGLGFGGAAVLLGVSLGEVAQELPIWLALPLLLASGICNFGGLAVAVGLLNLNNKWIVPRLQGIR